jgi:hypothetical protein
MIPSADGSANSSRGFKANTGDVVSDATREGGAGKLPPPVFKSWIAEFAKEREALNRPAAPKAPRVSRSTSPAAGRADDQLARHTQQTGVGGRTPVAARAFGQVGILVGIREMYLALRRDFALVAVPGDPGDIGSRYRIAEHLQRLLRPVPVVIPFENTGGGFASRQGRAEILGDQFRPRMSIEEHARVVRGIEARLVLQSQREYRYPLRPQGIDMAVAALRTNSIDARSWLPAAVVIQPCTV